MASFITFNHGEYGVQWCEINFNPKQVDLLQSVLLASFFRKSPLFILNLWILQLQKLAMA